MKEIGSEFWLENNKSINYSKEKRNQYKNFVNFGKDQQHVFSGRTAIDLVLQDIKRPIRSVYMPSYSCGSMLQPFIKRNIKVKFYGVIANNNRLEYKINYDSQIDIFFAMSYFGYHDTNMDSIVKLWSQKDVIVIEDITHRLLSKYNNSQYADYYIASLRKWFPIPSGGIAIKQKGTFKKVTLQDPPKSMIEKKVLAMKRKAEYIKTPHSKTIETEKIKIKSRFLMGFSEFNNRIKYTYKNTRIDEYSYNYLLNVDIQEIIDKRRENAEIIYSSFINKNFPVKMLINNVDFKTDCLLFVPILIKNKKRNLLREHLINNKIYCPIHWPIPKKEYLNNSVLKVYKQELSLICDQRYEAKDMYRMIEIIKGFLNTK